MNVYASFSSTKNKYTINFVNWDNSVLQSTQIEYGIIPTYNGEDPTKQSTQKFTYTFEGWTPEISAVLGEATYTATFASAKNVYTIKFVNHDGVELQSQEIEYGIMPSYEGAIPTKANNEQYTFSFDGWSPSITFATKDVIYTAKFSATINKYTITFYSEDGLQVLGTSTVDYGTNANYSSELPTKDATLEYSYSFVGWVSQMSGNTEDDLTNVIANRSVYAKFSATKNKYEVRFVDWNYSELQSEELEYGLIPTFKGTTPTREATPEYSYNFTGWTPEIVSVVGAVTYTATYASTKNKYLVKFVNWDNSELQSEELEYGIIPSYKGETPTRR